MAKHVHIYLPPGMSNRFVPAKVKDSKPKPVTQKPPKPCGCHK